MRFGKFSVGWADDHLWAGEEEEEEVEDTGEGVECLCEEGKWRGDRVTAEVEPPRDGVGEDVADVYCWVAVFDVKSV